MLNLFPGKSDRWVLWLSLTVTLGYVFSLLSWYVSTLHFWLLGLAALCFIFLWVLVLFFALFWLIRKRIQLAAVYLILFLLGWSPATASFSVGSEIPFLVEKKAATLRVMQWNANELSGNHKNRDTDKYNRLRAVQFVQKYQPDVICIDDFSEIISKHNHSNKALLKDTLGYIHQFTVMHAYTPNPYGWVQQGIGIFSKVPFLDSGSLAYPDRNFPEHILWVDLPLQGHRVRVVATHFRSMNLRGAPAFNPRRFPVYQKPDSAIIMSGNLIEKLRFYQREHALQATFLRSFLDTCSFPVIFCADLNTVPASHTYQKVRGNLRDDFITATIGLGATFNYMAPHIRIDYMLSSRLLKVEQWKHFEDGFSDHDHLMGDYGWKKDIP